MRRLVSATLMATSLLAAGSLALPVQAGDMAAAPVCKGICFVPISAANADDYLKTVFSKKARAQTQGEGLPLPWPFPWAKAPVTK
jgi:hypothetical protein